MGPVAGGRQDGTGARRTRLRRASRRSGGRSRSGVASSAATDPSARRRRTLTASILGYAAVIAALTLTRSAWIAAVALVGGGIAWIGVLTTLNASLQLTLPAWVRARGLAFYLLAFQGCQAVGSLLWGAVAQRAGVRPALTAAAASLVLAALAHVRWPLHDAATADSTTPVIVEYRVRPGNTAAFLAEMDHVGRSRQRTGAFSWGLYADTASPDRLFETFLVRSWSEHLAQHHERQTGLDSAMEARARNLLTEPPQVVHAVAHERVQRPSDGSPWEKERRSVRTAGGPSHTV